MCRKPKLVLEFCASANGKADLQITSLRGRTVPTADPQGHDYLGSFNSSACLIGNRLKEQIQNTTSSRSLFPASRFNDVMNLLTT